MRKITDEDVYKFYLGEIVVGDMYNSPIPGRKDRTPSFQLYEKEGKLLWIDYGLPNQFGNSSPNLVQYLRDINLTHKGYHDAVRLINREVKLGMIGKPLTQLRRRPKRDAAPYLKSKRSWQPYELAYWHRFDIDQGQLELENIWPVGKMSWTGEEGFPNVVSTEEDPAFVYWWNMNPASWKIYRPLAPKKARFRQENVHGVIEGFRSMENSLKAHPSSTGRFKILFIVSSTKDRLVVKHAFADRGVYNAINPRGERDRNDIIKKKDHLSSIAERIVILFDADKAGWEGAKILGDATGFEYYDTTNKLFGQKDFADVVDKQRGNKSYWELTKTIKDIINA